MSKLIDASIDVSRPVHKVAVSEIIKATGVSPVEVNVAYTIENSLYWSDCLALILGSVQEQMGKDFDTDNKRMALRQLVLSWVEEVMKK